MLFRDAVTPAASEERAYRLIERAREYGIEARREGNGTSEIRARVARHVTSSAAQRAGAISARELRGSPGLRTPIEVVALLPAIRRILRRMYGGSRFDLRAISGRDGVQGISFVCTLPNGDQPGVGRELFSTTERTYPGRIVYRMVHMIELCLLKYGIASDWKAETRGEYLELAS